MKVVARSILLTLSLTLPALGLGAIPVWVPEELKPWIPWVTEGEEFRSCPFLMGSRASDAGDFRCAWPGTLSLDAGAGGATFEQDWSVSATEQWIPLPGEADYWPLEVKVDGRTARVYEKAARPALRLAPGEYRITGRFQWDSLPRTLQIPAEIGLVRLVLDGETVGQPQRAESGLFLGRDLEAARAEDGLDLQVYRLVEDQIPTRLTTQLRLEVAGAVREETVGPVLPAGFVPQSLTAPMPARVEADGTMRLQVSPGTWTVTLVARADDLVDEIAQPAADGAWPSTEIWSYRGDDRLRVAVPSGLTTVDPSQVGVPRAWAGLPAFSLGTGETFRLEQRRRGGMVADNELTLERNIWLDFDGDGMTALDELNGRMHRRWRLEMREPYALLGARDSDGQPLLITELGEGGQRGIEWRESQVALQAVSRLPADNDIPASGWSERLASANAMVHLPPGYRLGAALGADWAPGVWLSRWRLLDLFVVLLTAAAAGRLYGRGIGALTLATLVLVHQDLPAFSWLLLNLMAAIALARVAPEGRLRSVSRWYRRGSLAVLVLLVIPFAVTQIKLTLYPQLESYSAYVPGATMGPATVPVASEMKQRAESQVAAESADVTTMARDRLAVSPAPDAATVPGRQAARYAPGVRVQTGPGLPAWRWNSYRLSWSGPVDQTQTLGLVILPRWLVALWRLAMVGLSLGVLWWVGRDTLAALRRIRLPASGPAILIVAASFIAGGLPAAARAETPPPELLQELKQRLLRAPDCVPGCATLVSAEITVDEQRLELGLQVNALAEIAVPLPGSDKAWLPQTVSVDGAPGGRLYRDEAHVLWLPVAAGTHRIAMDGRLPDIDKLQLAFPVAPKSVTVQASGWSVAGLRGRRLVAGTLEFTRLREPAADSDEPDWDGTRFPDFLLVERIVSLGLDWSVTTRVVRVAPADGSISAEVPLLAGEAVTTEGVTVQAGRVRVALGPGQDSFGWRSTLAKESPLTLTAPKASPWSERWQFDVSSLWHASIDGIPVYQTGGVSWQPLYLPRPGETLTVAMNRPAAIEGTSLAIDQVQMSTEFGARASQTTMRFDYRSSLGGPHTISLPEGAELVSLSQDGQTLPLPAVGEQVRIPALPGAHVVALGWREGRPIGLRSATPAVDLAAPTSNISVSAAMPANRWTLLTLGPSIGPAVLYWSELAALALVAFGLGRTRLTPLRTWHWFLLGLGFSTFAWPAFGLVVVWLLAMGWRGRWLEDMPDNSFISMQTLIALLSIAALLGLIISIPIGLLGMPDMHIVGNGSYGNQLNWFQDRSDGVLPIAAALSLPLWIYKVAILLWALWLSFALMRWLPWAWQCFSHGGIWRGRVGRQIPKGDRG